MKKNYTRCKRWCCYLLLLFGALLYSFTGNAQHAITIDGDPSDWAFVFGSTEIGDHLKDPIDKTDDIWDTGSSDVLDIPDWAWKTNGANDKNNIANAGFYLDGNVLYMYADRHSNNGDAAIGIWLLKDDVYAEGETKNGFQGVHKDGDVLLISHFVNGGAKDEIWVYRWIGEGESGHLEDEPCVCTVGVIEAQVNQTAIAAPASWNYTPKQGTNGVYPPNSFFEGCVDLTAPGIDLDPCYTKIIFETRQSQSVDASTEDLLIGEFGSIPEPKALLGSEMCDDGSHLGTVTLTALPGKTPPASGVNYVLYNSIDAVAGGPTEGDGINDIVWDVPKGEGYYVIATNKISLCVSEPFGDADVVIWDNPKSVAGSDQAQCEVEEEPFKNVFTLVGTVTNGNPTWSVLSNPDGLGVNILSANTATTDVEITGVGTVTLELEVAGEEGNLCPPDYDDLELTVYPNPVNDAGPDQAQCEVEEDPFMNVFTMAATSDHGTDLWEVHSNPDGLSVNIVDDASLTTGVEITGVGTVTLKLTTSSTFDPDCGSVEDFVELTVYPNPVNNAGPDQAECEVEEDPFMNVFTMAATSDHGTDLWEVHSNPDGLGVTIVDDASLTTDVQITGTGTVTLKLTTSSTFDPDCGSVEDFVELTVYPNPVNNAGPDQAECEVEEDPFMNVFTMAATSDYGTDLWEVHSNPDGLSVNIVDDASLTTDVEITGVGTVTLKLTTSSIYDPDCGDVEDFIDLTVNPNPALTPFTDEWCIDFQPTEAEFDPNDYNADILDVGQDINDFSFSWDKSTLPEMPTDIYNEVTTVYNVTVTHELAPTYCQNTSTLTITVYPGPEIQSLVVSQQVSWLGAHDGAIDLEVDGGTPPYEYDWVGPLGFTASTQDLSDLYPGVYSVIVTDARGCEVPGDILLPEPPSATAELDPEPISCAYLIDGVVVYTCDGAINATVSGVASPYKTYIWTGPDGFTASTEDISNLCKPGLYQLVIQFFNDAAKTELASILPSPIEAPYYEEEVEGYPESAALSIDITSVPGCGEGGLEVTGTGYDRLRLYRTSDDLLLEDISTSVSPFSGFTTVLSEGDYYVKASCESLGGIPDFCDMDDYFTVEPCPCETAFGYGGYLDGVTSRSFLNDCTPAGPWSNWGWTNYITSEGTYEIPMYAGAPACEPEPEYHDHIVGTAVVDYSGGHVSITFTDLKEGYIFDGFHIWTDPTAEFPDKNAPGQWQAGTEFDFVGGWIVIHAVYCGLPLSGPVQLQSAQIPVPMTFDESPLIAYPNPFTDKVTFEFVSGKDAHGVLELYNIFGQRVARIMDRAVISGERNSIEYTPENKVTGIYLYRLDLDGDIQIGRVIYKE